LIAGTNMAVVSPDAGGCTTETNAHEILIQNETLKVKLFDTPSLDEGPRGAVPDKEARRILKRLVGTLMKQGDIHLIMYCVRGERVVLTLRRNYKFIQSIVKMRVPIVLVVTCLESYEPEMEKWWKINERTISNVGMTFAGHACVTTAMISGPKVIERRDQSYIHVCKLIEQCRLSNDTGVHTEPLRGTIHNIPSIMTARYIESRQDLCIKIVVVIGETGTGKSSLINLIAGKHVADTSAGMACCTLHWQEHPIEFDGGSYRVFDTVGLDDPHLGISHYLDAVENVHKLIQDLERQGGIDLLLLCMRAGRINAMLQSNYRLFHELLCDKKVPIVLVVTGLEHRPRMEEWWELEHHNLHRYGIHVAGHGCITAAASLHCRYQTRYKQLRVTICNLVKEFTADGQKQAIIGGNSLFMSFMGKLSGLLVGNGQSRVRKDMISCLTQRCGVSLAVAEQLADRIKKDAVRVR
ncbi:P-loop containing nucleoside triphosphate hydrolase protein, partial [Suillus clintonianus]|uniref:P-loop containing nucleoside triphosphate hydrolase protein n=1 Tax=Suillus clintonianus TaxID=1904413 RepID=UPI001B85D369